MEVKPLDGRGPRSRCAGRFRTSRPSPLSVFDLGPSAFGARTLRSGFWLHGYFQDLTQRLTYRHSSRKAIPIPVKMNGQPPPEFIWTIRISESRNATPPTRNIGAVISQCKVRLRNQLATQ